MGLDPMGLSRGSHVLQEAIHTEAARDLRALLRLLGHVTQRDLSSGAGGGGGGGGSLASATAANAHSLQASLDTAQVSRHV